MIYYFVKYFLNLGGFIFVYFIFFFIFWKCIYLDLFFLTMGFSKLLSSVRLAQSTINLSKSVFARQCSSSGLNEACVCPGKDSGEPVHLDLYFSGILR